MKKSFVVIFAALLVLSASLYSCKDSSSGEEETSKQSTIIIDETTSGEDSTVSESSSEDVTVNETESESEAATEEITEASTDKPSTEYTFNKQEDLVYVKAFNGAVNLRSDTIISSDTVVISIDNDTELQRVAISDDGEWSRVIYDTKECYVKTVYLTTMADPDEGFETASKTLYLSSNSLFVRIVPSSKNEAVGTLYKGDKIDVVAENEELGWYRIKFEGQYAKGEYYISSDPSHFSTSPIEAE